jgi:hypothetical protein
MNKDMQTPDNSLNLQSKDNQIKTQFKKTFEEFFKQPQTMKELSVSTGIDRANIAAIAVKCEMLGLLQYSKKPIVELPNIGQINTPPSLNTYQNK